jgi:hypothetical protein
MSLTDAQYQEHVREDMPMDLPMEIAWFAVSIQVEQFLGRRTQDPAYMSLI